MDKSSADYSSEDLSVEICHKVLGWGRGRGCGSWSEGQGEGDRGSGVVVWGRGGGGLIKVHFGVGGRGMGRGGLVRGLGEDDWGKMGIWDMNHMARWHGG